MKHQFFEIDEKYLINYHSSSIYSVVAWNFLQRYRQHQPLCCHLSASSMPLQIYIIQYKLNKMNAMLPHVIPQVKERLGPHFVAYTCVYNEKMVQFNVSQVKFGILPCHELRFCDQQPSEILREHFNYLQNCTKHQNYIPITYNIVLKPKRPLRCILVNIAITWNM